jgi:DHA2 family lincomycin resistance protein-like MFS transporter
MTAAPTNTENTMAAAAVADVPDAPETAEHRLTPRDKLVIGILLVSTFVVILNETIMAVALPRLMDSLQVSASAVQWLTTAFLITMAVVIPVTGFLIQRIETRPIFISAMVLFNAGTLICALAPGLAVLIVGRIVQASGTAIMLPLLMTTVMTLVPAAMRGRIMGNISIVISVAPALGPTLSGLILHYLPWRFMFIVMLPIALAATLYGARRIANVGVLRYAPLDVASVILSALGFGGIVYGLSSFGETSGEPGPVPGWTVLVVGAVAMAIFILRQVRLQRLDRALLDLRTFASANFTIAIAMMAVCMASLFGTIILLPIYLQYVIGIDTLQTGLLLLPGGLVMGLMAPRVGRLYDRYGTRPLIIPGAIIVSAVMWALTMVGEDTSVTNILIGHIAISIGLGLVFTPLFTASLSSVPPQLYSHGSAIGGVVPQIAGAAGVALFVALMSVRQAALAAEGLAPVAALTGGIQLAFLVGAILSLLAVAASLFVRKPEEQPGAESMHH